MSGRRIHGKRSTVARIAKARASVRRAMARTIEREATMCLAHALLALDHARRFVKQAEGITARTL